MSKKLLIIIVFFILLSNCNENTITNSKPEPGRRDYTWTVDTINSFNPLYRLWGSSPTDVWAITIGTYTESIFHFDGDEWSTDGVFRSVFPHSIWGFASDDIYIGGGNGEIWHFNGNFWQEIATISQNEHRRIVFSNIWGILPDELYAIGAYPDDNGYYNNSVIAHYKNKQWTILNTSGIKGIVARLYKDRVIYFQVIKFSGTYDSTFIYSYNQKNYTKLYSTVWSDTWANISLINGEVYFVLENKIALRKNNKFHTILNLSNSNFYQRIWGRNSKDIFLLMTDGLAHYNGIDIEYLFHFNKPRTQIYGAALFEKEIFFLVYESPTNLSLIYHGKLK